MSTLRDESPPRQRVSRACDLCRKKKVKCDGASPVCTNCKGIGLSCTFQDMTKKRGPPKGYIEAIENRLYKLENFLAELAKGGDAQSKQLLSELNSPLETPTGEQIRVRPVRRTARSEKNKVFFWQQDKDGKRKREALTNDDHSVDEGVGQLAMDENGQVRYLGKSSGYYLLQNSRTYQNGAFHFATYGNRPSRQQKKLKTVCNPQELPPKDLSDHLINLYFNHFYPFLPLFYKRELCTKQISPLLLNSIYAIASRISPDVRVRSSSDSSDTAGDVYYERAEKLLDESYDVPSIGTVQALLLLASHQHGRMKSAKAWLYSGMAFRMAQDLGLHRNCDHWNIPPDECERRKRVFWCCYIVDRLSSAMYGRASTFEERDCDTPFPSVDDIEPIHGGESTPVKLLDTFINLIKICDILGNVLKNIYYVRSLQNPVTRQADTVLTTWSKKLHQWHDQLPDSLQIKKDATPPTAVCQLHMIYHTTVILLHRPFIPGPNQSLVPSLLPCASICSSAADSVLSITNAMLSENKLRYVMNYAVYYIFTSALIFITSGPLKRDLDTKSSDANFKVQKCMQALDEIEGTWTTASKNCQIIAELSGFRDINLRPETQQQQQQQQQQQPDENMIRWQQQEELHRHQVVQDYPLPPQQQRRNMSNLRYTILPNGKTPDFGVANPFQPKQENLHIADPFAAPGIIPTTDTRYEMATTDFWDLDVNEWNNFMAQPDMYQDRRFDEVGEKQHLIHTDQNVDVLSGVPTPLDRKPTLLSYVPQYNNNQHTNTDGRPSNTNTNNNNTTTTSDNAYYW